jgi:hypothetical protein
MMLTLLLRSLKWSDVGEKKKEKAIKKMSRFFLIPTVISSTKYAQFIICVSVIFTHIFSRFS